MFLMVLVYSSCFRIITTQYFDQCCRLINVKSSKIKKEHEEKVGVYKKINGKLNNHPVYKVAENSMRIL